MGSQQIKQILHGIKRRLHRPKPEEARGEKGPDFYDQVFLENEDLRVHYTNTLATYKELKQGCGA